MATSTSSTPTTSKNIANETDYVLARGSVVPASVITGSIDPGVLPVPWTVANGGTGHTTLGVHHTLVGNGTANITTVAPAGSGTVWTSNGVSADPSFQALPTNVATGVTSLTNHGVVGSSGSTLKSYGAGNTGQFLGGNTGADPSWQTPVSVPDESCLVYHYLIEASIASGATQTPVNWSLTLASCPQGFNTGSFNLTTGIWTCAASGKYKVDATLTANCGATVAGAAAIGVQLNSLAFGNWPMGPPCAANNGNLLGLSVSVLLSCSASDTLQIKIYNGTGAAITVAAADGAVRSGSICIQRIT